MAALASEKTDAKRIGFLADTHCRKDDGSDLPQQALDALASCGLIVHLGDVGKPGVLDRLGALAKMMTPKRGACEVIEAGDLRIGVTFDITKAGIASMVGEDGLTVVDKPLEPLLTAKFGGPVKAVAFGGTHRQLRQGEGGVLFFNPGSPNLPSDKQGAEDLGGVAILDFGGGKASVEFIRLKA